MSNIELVESLINDAENLPYLDYAALHALTKRSEMIIRRLFGESSRYLKDLNDITGSISLSTVFGGSQDEVWRLGKQGILNIFNTMLEEIRVFGASKDVKGTDFSNQIFVVHGHDEEMKQSVARTLETLGLEPIILHERPDKGRTIIEKLEDYSDVGFAVVLLSPDDFCYPTGSLSKDAKPRARQNVILELGFFIGKLGRGHVIALYRAAENFEIPSDYSGVIYKLYDASNGWKLELVKELKASNYDVDANKLYNEFNVKRKK